MRRLFVDASFWIALHAYRDEHQARARTIFAGLRGQNLEVATTNWTVYEALPQARRRSWEVAATMWRRISESARIVTVDEKVEREALRRFLEWKDKTASIVDHASALVAIEERCDAVASFDADFGPLVAATSMTLLR